MSKLIIPSSYNEKLEIPSDEELKKQHDRYLKAHEIADKGICTCGRYMHLVLGNDYNKNGHYSRWCQFCDKNEYDVLDDIK